MGSYKKQIMPRTKCSFEGIGLVDCNQVELLVNPKPDDIFRLQDGTIVTRDQLEVLSSKLD